MSSEKAFGRERPILFNAKMVKAILEGRKTQTRRLVKGLPMAEPWFTVEDGKPMMCDENGEWYPAERFSIVQPGDILWVRETWDRYVDGNTGETVYIYKTHCRTRKILEEVGGYQIKWRPSIHMPKEAARLFLHVARVRCERLQDMTPEDCANDGGFDLEAIKAVGIAPLFGPLWDSTVNKDAIARWGWEANPWVWMIDFKVIGREKA